MNPRIETLPEKKLIGQHLSMSLANNKTGELWRNFMPRRKEIKGNVDANLFSMQVYPSTYDFTQFNPMGEFTKWAAIEVNSFDNMPDGMNTCTLEGGLYAVFSHVGDASTGPAIFGYIYGTWLPQSMYALDNRPHFELLGEKYKNDDSQSEEEIWIPIRPKK